LVLLKKESYLGSERRLAAEADAEFKPWTGH
jgi:hypothetical protein